MVEAWLSSTITMEKLKTIMEMSPVMQALKMVSAVSPLFTTSKGMFSTRYPEIPLSSRYIMIKANNNPDNAKRLG